MKDIMRTWAEVNLDNAADNIAAIKKYTGAKIIAVVKADAYGHGVIEMAEAFRKAGVDFFAVACLNEAIELRKAGVHEDILILGATPESAIEYVADYDIIQTVFSSKYAKTVSDIMQNTGKTVRVHFKVDTGMGRLGFHAMENDAEKTASEIASAASFPGIISEGIYMHFCDAENEDQSFTEKQLELFDTLVGKLNDAGVAFEIIHCANSAAVINCKKAHLNYVRPGLILYGLYPDGKRVSELHLKPAMSLKSRICDIRTVRAGESVSYGRTFIANRDIKVAVVPAGYADGVNRGLSGKISFLIHGKKAPVLGRICMDMCVVDISDIDNAQIGDIVTLFGADGSAEISVDEWAAELDTISYEICSLITKRVPRIYVRNTF